MVSTMGQLSGIYVQPEQVSQSLGTEVPAPGTPEWNTSLPKPEWLKVRLQTAESFGKVKSILRSGCLHTVCQEARCPNVQECWNAGTATFIVMGDICTRSCAYCAVKSGHPLPLDGDEPRHVAEAVKSLGLKYAVITSVDRDDTPDCGAAHLAAVVREIYALCPGVKAEVLIPDFQGRADCLQTLLEAGPTVLNHNVETVPRLYPRMRSKGIYSRCLELLERSHRFAQTNSAGRRMLTKSGLMVGLGETEEEVVQVMRDLREVGVDIITIGQYLRPSLKHVPVMRYWTPQEFAEFKRVALQLGFKYAESSPLARSSYHAATHSA